MYGTTNVYTLAVGGSSGFKAQIARRVVSTEEISPIIRSILAYYRKHGKNKERLGQTILRYEELVRIIGAFARLGVDKVLTNENRGK